MSDLVWFGPYSSAWEGGITQSMLKRWLECRHRFWLCYVAGLQEIETWNYKIYYGSMFHEGEEALRESGSLQKGDQAIRAYGSKLTQRFPGNERDITKWCNICRAQFPIYIEHWSKVSANANRSYVIQEKSFKVPYRLPSGRIIYLRGKWDAAYMEKGSLYLQENKTKGDIDEVGITDTIGENLQTMFYFIALEYALRLPIKELKGIDRKAQLKGLLYNVIRRPLADRNALRPKKGEGQDEFIQRVMHDHSPRAKKGEEASSIYPIAKNGDRWFMRWNVLIHKPDLLKFKTECFDAILEQFCNWWDWVEVDPQNPYRKDGIGLPGGGIHFRYPWGVYHPLASGFRGSYYDYLTKGSTSGLTDTRLFSEL